MLHHSQASIFFVTSPRDHPVRELPILTPSPESRSVLVVDTARMGNLLGRILESGSHRPRAIHSAVDALKSLRDEPTDAIVVDMDAEPDGLKFAELVGMNPRYERIPVVITSARPMPDSVAVANNAGASSFLAKPFGPAALLDRIDGLTAKAQDGQSGEELDLRSVFERVKEIRGLPAMPATHAEILALANDPTSSSEDIAERLQLDPGLLATVFKLVNSAGLGVRRRVRSLNLAVSLIGLEEVANLVSAAQVFARLGGSRDETTRLDPEGFWKHSVGTAFISRALARRLHVEAEASFLVGILHDVGKVVLDQYFSPYYQAILEIVDRHEVSLADAEERVLGLTHAEVGGQLATHWNFDDRYLYAISYHHRPVEAGKHKRLVCLTHLADVLCRRIGYGTGGDRKAPEPNHGALQVLSIGARALESFVGLAEAEVEQAEAFLSALGTAKVP